MYLHIYVSVPAYLRGHLSFIGVESHMIVMARSVPPPNKEAVLETDLNLLLALERF